MTRYKKGVVEASCHLAPLTVLGWHRNCYQATPQSRVPAPKCFLHSLVGSYFLPYPFCCLSVLPFRMFSCQSLISLRISTGCADWELRAMYTQPPGGSYFNNLERIFSTSHCFCFVFLTHLLHQDCVLSGFSLSSGSKPRSLTCSMLDSLVARVAYDGGFSSFLVNLASKDFKCFIELHDRKKINLAAEFKWQPNSEYEILNWYGQNKNAAHYIA